MASHRDRDMDLVLRRWAAERLKSTSVTTEDLTRVHLYSPRLGVMGWTADLLVDGRVIGYVIEDEDTLRVRFVRGRPPL